MHGIEPVHGLMQKLRPPQLIRIGRNEEAMFPQFLI